MGNPVSMADVALAAGVSKNTVSLALRGDPRISAPTSRRILRVSRRLGYKRNPVVGELMARLHSGGARRFQCALALINANADRRAFTRHPTIPVYVRGCRGRAAELGYRFEEFWMHDQSLAPRRMVEILKARGIPGGVIVGMMDENRIPSRFLPVIEALSFVVTGVRTRDPELSFACVDHHTVALKAFEKALESGFRRPGLVLDSRIDALVDHRFTAGYRTGQESLPRNRRLRPFLDVLEARRSRSVFREWLVSQKPDVLFTLYNEAADWVAETGLGIPLIQYEWREKNPTLPGMDQHNDLVGKAAVDMLVGMLHRSERGVPPFPVATLISPSWRDAG